MGLEFVMKVPHPAGVPWRGSTDPVVILLLLEMQKEESGHKKKTEL